MASPVPLAELGPESEEDQELSRMVILVGRSLIDVGLPARVSISVLIHDVIELANEQVRMRNLGPGEFDNTEGRWTFARLTGGAIDADRSLADVGVRDGDILVVSKIGAPASSLLVDDIEGADQSLDNRKLWFAEHGWRATWFTVAIALSAATSLVLPSLASTPVVAGVPIAAIAALVSGVGCAAVASLISLRSADPGKSAWLAGVALPLIFGGSLHVVPGVTGWAASPIALALTALIALLQLLVSGRGIALYTSVIALALFGAPAAMAQPLLNPDPRTVGTILATVAVIVVYLAPRVTIVLSRLPVPRVPTAGEPLDDIETHGGTAVEGVNAIGKQVIPTEESMLGKVRRATQYLTGIVAAAAIVAIAGCYPAVDGGNGFFWQGAAFATAIATVLCLRGRSHHDLVQSAVLIGAGLVIALIVIVKTATFVASWQANAAVALVVLTALLLLCGLVAPKLEFSPVMRRWVEIAEYVAIGLVFPLACWIIRLYAFFRELRI
ncbi:type VII secretion integral membrane protein EccD [Mycobacterium sp. AZCC_0083]|uniref:type VII secretion integral membrane protein EccD n=1 Tax=Mycobacterium sp. AZCC_0083 TaxID=2735882 RepID=UPI001609574E|nr:type VII secretion integral membrane protein EccD [Mycobacterium sp. AZCC_0083]MBB5167566.1 type VII secretion integral membrane protein EccD [Mycobacterium sp. AZCC_0083]